MHVRNLDCNRTRILTNPPTLLYFLYKKCNYYFNINGRILIVYCNPDFASPPTPRRLRGKNGTSVTLDY